MYRNTQDAYTWTVTFFREQKDKKQYITSKIPPNADPLEALEDIFSIVETNFSDITKVRICIHFEELDYQNPEWSRSKEFNQKHNVEEAYESLKRYLFREDMPKFNVK
jgi:hypothetical protein